VHRAVKTLGSVSSVAENILIKIFYLVHDAEILY